MTQGILNLLTDEELEGVLAHELGHVRNRDILISSIAATLAGAITFLARMGILVRRQPRRSRRGGGMMGLLMLILAPIAATLIQLAVSRSREYEADATGAQLTGNPYALASALDKLDAYSKRVPMAGVAINRSPVHRGSQAVGRQFRQPVLYPSADRQAH